MSITLDGSNVSTIGVINSGTAQNTTSGTSIDFTGIPAGVKRIVVMFDGVSTSGSSIIQIQLGTSGGIVNSGYVGNAASCGNGGTWTLVAATSGFYTEGTGAPTFTRNGIAIITNISGNIWTYSGNFAIATSVSCVAGGGVTLGAVLDRTRITTVNGTDTFDAGSVNIQYE